MKDLTTPTIGSGDGSALQGYEFGPFRLDWRTRELRRDDDLVSLTPKAFDLLLVLLSAGNRAIEKSELMKLVWPDSFVGEDSLTHNIAALRKALGDVTDRPQYILTVPRHGYRFVAPVRRVMEEIAVEAAASTMRGSIPSRGPGASYTRGQRIVRATAPGKPRNDRRDPTGCFASNYYAIDAPAANRDRFIIPRDSVD